MSLTICWHVVLILSFLLLLLISPGVSCIPIHQGQRLPLGWLWSQASDVELTQGKKPSAMLPHHVRFLVLLFLRFSLSFLLWVVLMVEEEFDDPQVILMDGLKQSRINHWAIYG